MKVGGMKLLWGLPLLCGVAIAVVFAGLLLDGFWSSPFSFCIIWRWVALCCALPCIAAWWLIREGRRLRGGGDGGGTAFAVAGAALFLLVAAGVGRFLYTSGPWFDGIAAQGMTPDGDEWVLSQAWIDWDDAYGLRLFTRKPGGMWHSWWGGPFWKAHQSPDRYEVRLDGSRHWPEIHFARGGERIFQHNRQDMHPADLSPAELHAAHRAETGPNRSLLASWKASQGGGQ